MQLPARSLRAEAAANIKTLRAVRVALAEEKDIYSDTRTDH